MKKANKNIRRIHNVFGFRHKVHSVKTEIFAGLSTFFVMAYILALAPKAFNGVGGTEVRWWWFLLLVFGFWLVVVKGEEGGG